MKTNSNHFVRNKLLNTISIRINNDKFRNYTLTTQFTVINNRMIKPVCTIIYLDIRERLK